MAPPTKARPLPGQPTRPLPGTPTTPPTKMSPRPSLTEGGFDPFGPLALPPQALATGLGIDFGQFMVNFRELEFWMDKGWSHKDRITAFRKIWYNNDRFNEVIKGTDGLRFPPMWGTLKNKSRAWDYLEDHPEITISGKNVDIGHLFAGTDAANHFEASLDFKQLNFQLSSLLQVSNKEFANFIGDLGSTVEAYVAEDPTLLNDVRKAKSANEADLRVFYDGAQGKTSPGDLAGDADVFVFPWSSSITLAENMENYYHELAKGNFKRFTSFAVLIGLGQLRADNTFENEAAQKPTLKVKIAAAARALGAKRAFDPRTAIVQPRTDVIPAATDLVIPMFLKSVRDEVIKEK